MFAFQNECGGRQTERLCRFIELNISATELKNAIRRVEHVMERVPDGCQAKADLRVARQAIGMALGEIEREIANRKLPEEGK